MKIAYINNILLVYGYDSPILAIDIKKTISIISTIFNEDFYFVSQFISKNDDKNPDGVAITDHLDIVYFNLSNPITI